MSEESVSSMPRLAKTANSFFFFQAEDGIRDYKVTGVQTCALPILSCEDMAGQFAGQRGLLLLQLGLDHGVAGPPHDRPAAVLGDVIIEDLRRLDFGDDRGARLLL